MCDPVKIVIIKFQNHPNILAIKHSVSIEEVFDFSCGETNDILKEIDSLDKYVQVQVKGGSNVTKFDCTYFVDDPQQQTVP